MIDLSSKDYSYTTLKVNEVKRMLKDINPDVIELTSSDILNISLTLFAYLIEGKFFDEGDEGDLIFTLYDDVISLNLEDVTLQLKFKNALANQILKEKQISEVKIGNTIKKLVGDNYGI